MSFGLAGAAMWAKQNSSSFLPFFWCTALSFAVGVILAITEIVRSLRQFETKIVFAAIYVSVIVCAAALTGFVLWQVKGDWTASQERQERERLQGEATRAGIEVCEVDRRKELGRLEKRRAEAQRALESCVAEFEAARTIFTNVTSEQHCRQRQAAIETVSRNHKLASTKRCDAPEGK